ncbi:hypothetical protein M427DRAFT_486081 [Gonapodya prolifera JEL478]|uniref:Uncharacterized protein n=1 Tax=Gonapodya prolifera (strain JEL478) TaxID=1344416 RepID=A0A139B092_GONPJ|nr:hypothetical protein M427DRAFT_486081 [Gonapodya prolifera JEL478]|eukprot:KXS22223.1 hypothetical protein M427DRAFT_486081 [Gonapodya prolifera JEL478]
MKFKNPSDKDMVSAAENIQHAFEYFSRRKMRGWGTPNIQFSEKSVSTSGNKNIIQTRFDIVVGPDPFKYVFDCGNDSVMEAVEKQLSPHRLGIIVEDPQNRFAAQNASVNWGDGYVRLQSKNGSLGVVSFPIESSTDVVDYQLICGMKYASGGSGTGNISAYIGNTESTYKAGLNRDSSAQVADTA